MSTTVTLQNADDLPSPVTLHFDDPDFELDCPHSPTSSLRGVFVRSRPSSMDYSAGEVPLDLDSAFAQYGLTGNNTRVPLIQAAPARQAASSFRVARPIFTRRTSVRDDATIRTARTCATTPVRAVRRVLDEDEDSYDAPMPPRRRDTDAPVPRSSTGWPKVARLVSGIFTRKHTSTHAGAPPPSPSATSPSSSGSDATSSTSTLESAPSTRRTFSFSLRANKKVPAAHTPVAHVAVRRSHSFSGFTDMLAMPSVPEPEFDNDFDDVALEAFYTARAVGQHWVYEEDEEEDGM
ncbi:hypothetical protein C8R47DRAFT_1255043 [Mycena vitilis]|nr:hypothetical protein C8R47DRAFT_1255043 [Mycena vitilis]